MYLGRALRRSLRGCGPGLDDYHAAANSRLWPLLFYGVFQGSGWLTGKLGTLRQTWLKNFYIIASVVYAKGGFVMIQRGQDRANQRLLIIASVYMKDS